MQIFSHNSWFISGLQLLLSQSGIENTDNIVFFDSGAEIIYLTSKEEIARNRGADSLSLFTEIRGYLLTKSMSPEEYCYYVFRITEGRPLPDSTRLLSLREKTVMQYYLNGVWQKEIARKMQTSERSVCCSQSRALRKMKIKNVSQFLSVMCNWRELEDTLIHY